MSDAESWWSDDDQRAVVIDNGSSVIRAGMSGDDSPRVVFPSVVGESKVEGLNLLGTGGNLGKTYIGDEAFAKRATLNLTYPVVSGRVDDLHSMEKLWNHLLRNELRVVPEEQPVLMNVKPKLNNHDKEDITEMMFEKFHVPSLYLAHNPTLILMSTGRETGLVLDCGHRKSRATPCYEGHCIPHASQSTRAASEAIQDYITKILRYADEQEPEDIARKLIISDFSEVYASESKYAERITESYDKVVINQQKSLDIKKDLDTANEAKFQPSVISLTDAKSLPQIVIEAVESCDPVLKWDLLGNVVLSGGGSMVGGLPERLNHELVQHYKPEAEGKKIKVVAAPERMYSLWIGGSTLSSLSYFDRMLITTSEYEECGPYIARRKCFA